MKNSNRKMKINPLTMVDSVKILLKLHIISLLYSFLARIPFFIMKLQKVNKKFSFFFVSTEKVEWE